MTDAQDPLTPSPFAAAWRANRPYLVNLAYGMLGDIGAAEDAVQEAFTRLARAEAGIEDARGWLIVVTSRICLDQINSAHTRRERAYDVATIEFAGAPALVAPPVPVDPADRITLDDEVRGALLLVLERLTPAERVVFVLHDVFQLPFDTIADTVGRPAPTCRQLARRARLKIRADQSHPAAVDVATHQAVVERFIEVCAAGDVAALIPLLDPNVWGAADIGPNGRPTRVVNHGATKVARNLLRWFAGTPTIVGDPLGEPTELLAFVDRVLYAVIRLTLIDGRVQQIEVTADPVKLAAISARLAGRGPANA